MKLFKDNTPKRNFGLVRDVWDGRDFYYKTRYKSYQLPESTNMKNLSQMPFVWDQGRLGSCVGQSVRGAFVLVLLANKMQIFEPSALFAYYNARTDDNKNTDSGASIRDGIKGLATHGICKESTWPYDVNKFAFKPSPEAYAEGELNQALIYERIYPVTKEAIMDAVYRGYPVVYGKKIFESFMSEATTMTGIVKYPGCFESELGGHAMLIGDYEKDNTLELNSWGKGAGRNGIYRVPWKYVLNPKYCFDFWTVYQTEGTYLEKLNLIRKK